MALRMRERDVAGLEGAQHQRDALDRDVGDQRRHDGREPGEPDHGAVEQPYRERWPRSSPRTRPTISAGLRPAVLEEGADDDDQAGQRPHGQVDAAGEDHAFLAERDERQAPR